MRLRKTGAGRGCGAKAGVKGGAEEYDGWVAIEMGAGTGGGGAGGGDDEEVGRGSGVCGSGGGGVEGREGEFG
jgi:hypothetical protein